MRIPAGADAGSIGKLLESKGVIADARFFELNATLTLRRGKLRTGNYVLRREMTNGAAIDALMQGPKVRVVKTFNVTIPEGLSRREAAPAVDKSGIERLLPEGRRAPSARSRAPAGWARRRAPGRSRASSSRPPTSSTSAPRAADLVDKQLDAFRDNLGAHRPDAARSART